MRTQLHNWRILVDHIIDKVWEYIDELDMWDDRNRSQWKNSLLPARMAGRSPTWTPSRSLLMAGLTSARSDI